MDSRVMLLQAQLKAAKEETATLEAALLTDEPIGSSARMLNPSQPSDDEGGRPRRLISFGFGKRDRLSSRLGTRYQVDKLQAFIGPWHSGADNARPERADVKMTHTILSKELGTATAKRLTASAYWDTAPADLLARNHANEDEDDLIPVLVGLRGRALDRPRPKSDSSHENLPKARTCPKSDSRKRCCTCAAAREPCEECTAATHIRAGASSRHRRGVQQRDNGERSGALPITQSSFESKAAITALSGFVSQCGGSDGILDGWYATQEVRRSGNTAGTTDTCAHRI